MKHEIYVGENSILFQHFRTKTSMNVAAPEVTYHPIGWSIGTGFIYPSKYELLPPPIVDGKPDLKAPPQYKDLTQEKMVARFLKDNPDFVIPEPEEESPAEVGDKLKKMTFSEEVGKFPSDEVMAEFQNNKQEEE